MTIGGSFIVEPIGRRTIFTVDDINEEQKEIARLAKEFAVEQILPRKKEIEQFNPELTRQLMRELGELGMLSIDIPEAYDGLGLDKVTSALVNEKIALSESGSFMVTFSAHTGIATLPIVLFGTEEQKKKYLPKLGSGEWIGAYGLTEPGAGTDALAAKTTAVLSEDGKAYILNGTKQFISNGGWCKTLICYAKIDGEKFTGFIVNMDLPGVEVGPEEKKMGYKGSSTTSVVLNNVRVPVEDMLGIPGKGHHIAFNTLNIGRYKLGAAVLGASKAAIDESVKYALERRQFGQPIAYFDAIKSKFANMIVRTYDLESILYRTVGDIDQAIAQVDPKAENYYQQIVSAIETFATEASMTKVFGTEAHWLTTDDGLQIFGGYGYTEEYPLAAMVRDTRVDRIFEGTNEINRQIITGHFLKKALTEELPIRAQIKQNERLLNGGRIELDTDILRDEKIALEYAKAITLYVFNESIIRYGQGLRHEQQLMEILADMFTDVYVMDSVLARVSQYVEKNGYEPIRMHIAQIGTAQKTQRITANARTALLAIEKNHELDQALNDLEKLSRPMHLRLNLFELRRELADTLYEHGKYML